MLPLTGLLVVITLNWQQFLALFGLGSQPAEFALRLKEPPLPWLYVTVILSIVLLFEVLPYLEELVRTLRAKRPPAYRDATAVPPRFQPRPPSP
jgi:hypothetical protein